MYYNIYIYVKLFIICTYRSSLGFRQNDVFSTPNFNEVCIIYDVCTARVGFSVQAIAYVYIIVVRYENINYTCKIARACARHVRRLREGEKEVL